MTELPKPYIYDATEDMEGWTKEQILDYGRANFELALVSDGDYLRAVISERDALRVENEQLREANLDWIDHAAIIQERNEGPVSYTHLTLPTNREV